MLAHNEIEIYKERERELNCRRREKPP